MLLALSALSWFLSALTAYLIFPALNMPVSWIASFLLLIILQVGVSIPSTPGKIGVFQVLCRWTLGLLGVSATLGLAYGVLLYTVVVLFLIVIGALALVWESWQVGHLPTELDTLLTHS